MRKLQMTAQRQLVLDIVAASHGHPTADEVYEKARQQISNISLGTVYRNLSQLVEAGFLNKVEHASEPARFDAEKEPHFHVRCTRCGSISDVPADVPNELLQNARGNSDYKITGCVVDYVGVCPKCCKESEDL